MSKAVQIRDVPDDAHRRLKARAAEEGKSLSELLRAELVEIASRPTLAEMLERLQTRERVTLRESSAEAIQRGRRER